MAKIEIEIPDEMLSQVGDYFQCIFDGLSGMPFDLSEMMDEPLTEEQEVVVRGIIRKLKGLK